MEIELGSLLSRAKAKVTRPGGIKNLLTGFTSNIQAKSQGYGGLLGWVFRGVGSVLGWFLKGAWSLVIKVISWSFSTAISWVQQTFNFIWTFDWNASDEQLDTNVKSLYQGLLSQAGGTLGASLGWLVGGILPGALVFVFNEPLGVYLLNHVGQEMIEELLPQIGALIQATLRTLTRHLFTATYKRLRKRLVGANEFKTLSDTQIAAKYQAEVDAGRMTAEQAKEAVERGQRLRDAAKSGFERKPWSFQKKMEEFQEKYIPKNLQDAAEEFREEFSEGFWEGLYVNASALDEYVAKQRLTRPAVLGTQTGVRITFNRNP